MNRRDFLKAASLAPFAGALPGLATANTATSAITNKNNKVVVLVELRGGNDSLNTLIPFSDPEYYKLRPSIAIKEKELIRLSGGMGMHTALQPLHQYWNKGQLAWIQGLGYEQPNRSHFRSREIWETAAHSNQKLEQGWVTQLFRDQSKINGISVSEALGPLAGKGTNNLRVGSPEGFLRRAERMSGGSSKTDNSALNHIIATETDVIRSATQLKESIVKTQSMASHFSNHALGKKLASVARLIVSGLDVPAYKIGLDGFDTHAKQNGKHNGLLEILAENLNAFANLMQQANRWQDVVVITYSEFGRKALENSSQGTDHGLASAQLVMGGRVRGKQIYGAAPSLTQLDGGSIQHTQDFRSVYATLAERWWDKSSPWNHQQIPFV